MEGIQKDNKACLKFQACFTSKIAILNIEPSSSPISFDWQWLQNQSQTSFSKIIKIRIPGQNEFHELSLINSLILEVALKQQIEERTKITAICDLAPF